MEPLEQTDAEQEEGTRDELAELKDLYLRTLADFDNYRKRVDRERDEIGRAGKKELLLGIIDIVDNFERAVASAASPDDERDPFRAGVLAINRQMQRLLGQNGVERFESVGARFDPERHEAVGTTAAPGTPADTVVAEERPGYLWNGKLLRPARVFVAADQQEDVH
jgi:molecular chaperone GrpE